MAGLLRHCATRQTEFFPEAEVVLKVMFPTYKPWFMYDVVYVKFFDATEPQHHQHHPERM